MKVFLADTNQLILQGLRVTLQEINSLNSIQEVKTPKQLLECTSGCGEAIVIIDYTADGFDIHNISNALRLNPSLRFIGLTYLQSAQTLQDALRGGVMSYVKKDCDLKEIKDAVIETARGNKFFCGKILETINKANLDVDDMEHGVLSCDPVMMTERENEIVILISEGYTNDQIADLLFLSKHTVNTHRKNILFKLGVKNTAGIVMYAVKTQLVSPNKFLFAPN